MFIDQLPQWDSHFLFDITGLIHVTGNTEELGARILGPAETAEPFRASSENRRYYRNRLDIIDRRWTAI